MEMGYNVTRVDKFGIQSCYKKTPGRGGGGEPLQRKKGENDQGKRSKYQS